MVHNGGSPNFKGLLFDKKTNYLAQILQSLSYKVYSIILPKFTTFVLFIPILGTSAIMDQTACCYDVTTSETGLFDIMKVEILSLSVTFVYKLQKYRSILNSLLISYNVRGFDVLHMPLFEGQLLRRKFHRN